MTKMRRQSLVAYEQPLCETIVDCPAPRGSEVLLRVQCCGVCHSDLHIQDGYFQLGGDKRLDITSGRALPFTLGHEIAGVVESIGDECDPAIVGNRGRGLSLGRLRHFARRAAPAKKISAPTRGILVSPSMAASPPIFWCPTRAIFWTTRRCRQALLPC